MSELKKYKLGELGSFFGGVTSIKKEDYGHGTPFLPYKNVYKNSKVNINELELMNVRPLDLDRRSAIYGDIFFTASSETPDEVAMSSVLLDEVENLTFNGFCKRFRLKNFNTLLPEYARYLFRDISFRNEVYQRATGDIRFNISQESLANIEIEIPDIEPQKEIADILSSLDDKIEINIQMNETFEIMAQAIYKEWFVDFKFPDFDGILIDGLPKGWKIGRVDELFILQRGFDLPTNQRIEGEYPVIAASGKSTYHYEYKVKGPGVTTGRSGVLGNVFYIMEDFWPLNTSLFIKEYKNSTPLFSYFKLKSLNLFQLNGGSAVPTLNRNDVHGLETIIPDLKIIQEFEKITFSLFTKIQENNNQIQSLIQTRDILIPKLINGKIEFV